MKYWLNAFIRMLLIALFCAIAIPERPQSIGGTVILILIFFVNDFRDEGYKKWLWQDKNIDKDIEK